MSLTDWVSFDSSLFDLLFDKPPFNLRGELKAAPLTNHYRTVGTAFDYAMRLLVSRINYAFVNDFPIVAEHGIKGNKIRQKFIADFDENRKAFLNGELPLFDLLPDCVVLAKLEAVFRSSRDFPNSEIFYVDDDDVRDLNNLIGLVEHGLFTAEKQCVLNPTFGQSSLDIGGADADFIVDGVLIDIKTTKFLKFTREYFRQLMGYYVLNLREGQMYGELERLGIYYSRFGTVFTFPAPDYYYRIERKGKILDLYEAVEESISEYQEA